MVVKYFLAIPLLKKNTKPTPRLAVSTDAPITIANGAIERPLLAAD